MTALFTSPIPSMYEPTVPQASRPAPRRTEPFGHFVALPTRKPRPTPRLQQLLGRLRTATGWSTRTMAQALGTTHPTVSALLVGRQITSRRLPELPGRLLALVELVERIAYVVEGEAASVDTALTTVPPGQDRSALDHLRANDLGRAYTTALDVLHPPRRTGMMRSVWPTTPGEATAALDDDSS